LDLQARRAPIDPVQLAGAARRLAQVVDAALAPGVEVEPGRSDKVGAAVVGYPVALRPTEVDGLWAAYVAPQQIKTVTAEVTSVGSCAKMSGARRAWG
jgi:hypothetical protein